MNFKFDFEISLGYVIGAILILCGIVAAVLNGVSFWNAGTVILGLTFIAAEELF